MATPEQSPHVTAVGLPKRTTTSYALLGILATGPMSAYELAKSMRFSGTRYLWPRTESRIYLEPRNLVNAGLATVSVEHIGRRARSVYKITNEGRRALTAWLDSAGAPQPPGLRGRRLRLLVPPGRG